MKRKVTTVRGFFSNWVYKINGEKHVCCHVHRTSSGAERCGKNHAKFLDKVDKIKAEMRETR